MQRHRVAQADEIPATGGLIVDVRGVEIGIFRADAATRERIFGGTAAELYGLDDVPDRATVTPPRERGRAPEGTVSGPVE